jgi:hypothetical protein
MAAGELQCGDGRPRRRGAPALGRRGLRPGHAFGGAAGGLVTGEWHIFSKRRIRTMVHTEMEEMRS